MKTKTKILGIGLIALIAMVGISAVSAEPVERTILGSEWIYDIGVTDDFDYFIYDGTSDTACADGWLRESIGGSETAVTAGAPYFTCDGTESAMDDSQFFKSVPAPAPVPVIPEYEIRANGIGYYDDSGVEYRDTITGSFGGITVDDWVVPSHEPNYDIHVYTNGMTGQLDDGDGNLLSVVPDSSLNPPRPAINVPYYPTDVTEI